MRGGAVMRYGMALIAASILIAASSGASAMMRIGDDMGGRIGTYVNQYSAMRNSGELIVIDGRCLSACTLILGIVPRNRICVTHRAEFGFHAAWVPGPDGRPVRSNAGTLALWTIYPRNVRQWISSRGGLSSKMMFLRGHELLAMYPACRNGDGTMQARAPRQPRATTASAAPGSPAATRAQKNLDAPTQP